MRKSMAFALLYFIACFSFVYAQSRDSAPEEILFLYEESNENLDPWINRIQEELSTRGIPFLARQAEDLEPADLANHGRILLYGAVMGFTLSEPLRDWLKTEPEISGKEVVLLVTANRWFLDKYTGQLEDLLEQADTLLLDEVTRATQELTEEEKDQIAAQAVAALGD